MDFLNRNRSLWASVAVAPVLAIASTAVQAQTWKINLRDADLTAFINEVAGITGKNFAVDPRVRGNVTVISNKALNRNEIYDLFLGVLNVNGVVAIPSGNTIRLVPDSNVKNSGLPFDSSRNARGDQVVTRVIWLENTNPNDLIPALRPLMPQFAHLASVQGTNALIVSDRASNIVQLESIIRNLDGTGQNDIEAIALQSSQAEELINLLESMSSTGGNKDVTGSRVRIVADQRTNRILIKGDPSTRKRIRQMIEMLDVPSADRLGGLKVFKLKFANAKNLAEILQGLVTGQATSANGNQQGNNSSNNQSNTNIGNNQNQSSSSISATPAINLNSNSNNHQNNNISSFNGNGVSIIADNAQNALVVKAEPQMMREIESAISQLDTRRKQVLIEATIIEISGNDVDQLGVQWALGDISSGVGLINFDNVGSSLSKLAAGYLGATTGGSLTGLGNAIGTGTSLVLGDYKEGANGSRRLYGALIQALKQKTKSNLLSTPSILTMDNEEAYIVVGQNVPFETGSVTTSGGTANPYTSIERKDVGVTLKVIPRIGEGGAIRLEVEQEVSNVTENKGQAKDLVTSKRAIKTSVLADHGQTIVLGGLIADDRNQSRQSVPFLGDIPGIGRLFRADNKTDEKRNLLIFIHPTIVGENEDTRKISQRRYDQLYSLQLALDKDGSFSKLPEKLEDVNQQRLPIRTPPKQSTPLAPIIEPVETPVAEPALEPVAVVETKPREVVLRLQSPNIVKKSSVPLVGEQVNAKRVLPKPVIYGKVPTGSNNNQAAVTTPIQMAESPAILAPKQQVEKTQNTVTTTTLRPVS